ncbi:MAG: hypothetical protein MUC68_03270 [Burkholderiaceae bacterium]|jgi:uncharacterized protein|nr:hypothetical protein [Burkholderiaceae bacterium]
MGRIVFFLLLALAVYIGWRMWRLQQTRGGASRSDSGRAVAERMVSCDECGLNVPQSEALPAPGEAPSRWYCCEAHRRQAAERR